MNQGKYLKLNLPDYTDAADIEKLVENFEILEGRAPAWTDFSNSGTVLESTGNFTIATAFPVGEENTIFAVTAKMPRAFAEDDTITVDDVVYNLYQGTDPALSEAWKAGEVVTINFDKTSRRCWASAGGGAPRPLPAQVSNMQASTPEGETPTIVFTWTNPVDENFAGMILVVKEGSAPNGVTDGTQVYKGTGTTFTYTEGVQWERTYYGRGFAYNSQDKFQMDATSAIASATPSNVPDQAIDVVLIPNKSKATLKWTNPSNQSYSTTKIIQKINSSPENPNDGTEIYNGTGITFTAQGLQDGVHYYFAVFTIGKNGKYNPPIVKDYTPDIYPKYDFTGNHNLKKDGGDDWRVKLLSSGNFTSKETLNVDIFVVGAGSGCDNSNGGGGGYTKTYRGVSLEKDVPITVSIGASAVRSGGTSSFGEYNASGGSGQAGGSGGGNAGTSGKGGAGGTDGSDGKLAESNGVAPVGKGQGTTTREFEEPNGDLYSGGGGGSAQFSGDGGLGTPILAQGGYSEAYAKPGKPGGGYGGGGGGNGFLSSGSGAPATPNGAQGIVIIRNARE